MKLLRKKQSSVFRDSFVGPKRRLKRVVIEDDEHNKNSKHCCYCWRFFVNIVLVFRAIFVRLMFIVYSFFTVWNLFLMHQNWNSWFFLIPVIFMFLELCFEIKRKLMIENNVYQKQRLNFLEPCVLLFLLVTSPPLWTAQIYSFKSVCHTASSANLWCTLGKSMNNNISNLPRSINTSLMFSDTENITREFDIFDNNITDLYKELTNYSIKNNPAEKISKYLSNIPTKRRVRLLKQIQLLFLIVGRWILPRRGISREQLSEILLISFGTAADILELYDSLTEDIVKKHVWLILIIMATAQLSMLQFALVKGGRQPPNRRGSHHKSQFATVELEPMKAPRPQKSPVELLYEAELAEKKQRIKQLKEEYGISLECGSTFCQKETIEVLVTFVLQDMPFFILRMFLLLYFEVFSYSNVFFTFKNALTILLQIFRLFVLSEHYKKTKKVQNSGEKALNEESDNFEEDEAMLVDNNNRQILVNGQITFKDAEIDKSLCSPSKPDADNYLLLTQAHRSILKKQSSLPTAAHSNETLERKEQDEDKISLYDNEA